MSSAVSMLQRSSVSFRRQGSSGRIWDDPLRGLDLKGLPSSSAAAAVAPLHGGDASILAGRPSHRAAIAESPEVAGSAGRSPATTGMVVVGGAVGARHEWERPARRRRRLSSAFCACMGHPPASHAQQ